MHTPRRVTQRDPRNRFVVSGKENMQSHDGIVRTPTKLKPPQRRRDLDELASRGQLATPPGKQKLLRPRALLGASLEIPKHIGQSISVSRPSSGVSRKSVGRPFGGAPDKLTGSIGVRARTTELKASTSREISEVFSLLQVSASAYAVEYTAPGPIDEATFMNLMNQNRPVVFRQYAKNWPCVKKWANVYYLKSLADEEARKLPHRKYKVFKAVQEEEGRVHLTDGMSKNRLMTFSEFLGLRIPGSYLLGIHEAHSKAGASGSAGTFCPVQPHPADRSTSESYRSVGGHAGMTPGGHIGVTPGSHPGVIPSGHAGVIPVPPLAKDLPESLCDLVKMYGDKVTGSGFDHQQFFTTHGYAFTDLHYDSYDNFYVTVCGRRKWTMAQPEASRWLVDSKGGSLQSGSKVEPNVRKFPSDGITKFSSVYPFISVTLDPGDILFVPACWWHLVESIPAEDSNLSVAFNYFFSKPVAETFKRFTDKLDFAQNLVNSNLGACRSRLARISMESRPESFSDSETEMTPLQTPRNGRLGHGGNGLMARTLDSAATTPQPSDASSLFSKNTIGTLKSICRNNGRLDLFGNWKFNLSTNGIRKYQTEAGRE